MVKIRRRKRKKTILVLREKDSVSNLVCLMCSSSRLTNDDFRKLMMTPRAGFGSGTTGSSNLGMGSVRGGSSSVRKTSHGKSDQKRAKKRLSVNSQFKRTNLNNPIKLQ